MQMSMAPSQLGCFAKSSPEEKRPNLQYHVQPLSLDTFGSPLYAFPHHPTSPFVSATFLSAFILFLPGFVRFTLKPLLDLLRILLHPVDLHLLATPACVCCGLRCLLLHGRACSMVVDPGSLHGSATVTQYTHRLYTDCGLP